MKENWVENIWQTNNAKSSILTSREILNLLTIEKNCGD